MMVWPVFLPELRILVFGLMDCWMLILPCFPRLMVMLLPLDRDLLVSSLSSIVFGLLLGWVSLVTGFNLGFLTLSSVLESGRGSVEAWYTSSLDIEEVLAGATDSHVHLFVADVVKSFDTVDRTILDRVLSSLGLPGWFRHAYFEYHAHVRMRFKLASGLGAPWFRDGGIPQGCPLSMMFIVALYLPWCRYLSAQVGVQPQLYADNLKCVSRDPDSLLAAARWYHWLCSTGRSGACAW